MLLALYKVMSTELVGRGGGLTHRFILIQWGEGMWSLPVHPGSTDTSDGTGLLKLTNHRRRVKQCDRGRFGLSDLHDPSSSPLTPCMLELMQGGGRTWHDGLVFGIAVAESERHCLELSWFFTTLNPLNTGVLTPVLYLVSLLRVKSQM